MSVAPERHVVVVDGSNLATEGRTTPSLVQLDEAVRAYAAEDPTAEIVVVVDASFEHRVDPSERKQLIDAELHGEVVSPPAGAIGRGDAFVLRIAERTGAVVLSNDSFQEFHAEHPWLFDKGRLVGGKPVPGVGWIFTPRIPVRGPKSRQATRQTKGEGLGTLSAPVKAAELAKAARKVAGRKAPVLPDGSTPKVGDVWPAGAPAAGALVPEEAETTPKGAAGEVPKKGAKERAKEQKKKKAPEQAGAGGGAAELPAATADAIAAAATQVETKAPSRATPAKKAPPKVTPAKKAPPKATPAKKAPGAPVGVEEREAPQPELSGTQKPRRGQQGSAATATEEASRRVASGKQASENAATTKKGVNKEPAAEVPVAKAAVKKAATKEQGAKKEPAAQPAVEKGATKKAATKKAAAKKAAAKKEAAAEPAVEKVATKKAATKKESAKKEPATKPAVAKALAPAGAVATPRTVVKAAAKAEATKAAVLPVAADGVGQAEPARSTAAKDPFVQEAIGRALAEAVAPAGAPEEDGRRRGDRKGAKGSKGGRHRRRSTSPLPAVNEPLAFITFVATYPLASEVEGEVVSYTSHGAMVDVGLPGGGVLHSYIPLTAMADPPPIKARQVLRRGERRSFVLAALDPARRVAELALPELVAAHGLPVS